MVKETCGIWVTISIKRVFSSETMLEILTLLNGLFFLKFKNKTMNKIKMSLLTVFIFGCVSVNAQMPHFSREKPHKPKTLIAQAGHGYGVSSEREKELEWKLATLTHLNDSLQKKLDKFVTFYSYVCPIMDALHLTDENKFQFKRAELAKRYRLYLEYYEPEYIANARKRQRK